MDGGTICLDEADWEEKGGGWSQYFRFSHVGHEMPVIHPNGCQAGWLAAEGDMGSREVFSV